MIKKEPVALCQSQDGQLLWFPRQHEPYLEFRLTPGSELRGSEDYMEWQGLN